VPKIVVIIEVVTTLLQK